MQYSEINWSNEVEFRTLTGITFATYKKMVEVLRIEEEKKTVGRKKKLCVENIALLLLIYLREYNSYKSTGKEFGISEAAAYQTVRWAENALIKHPDFALSGKRALEDGRYKTVIVDVTETPIQRPKKNSKNTTQERVSNMR